MISQNISIGVANFTSDSSVPKALSFAMKGGILDILGSSRLQVVGILLRLPLPELQELVAVPKKFQDRLAEALKAVGRVNNKGPQHIPTPTK